MLSSVSAEHGQQLLDRALDVVELAPDVPFLGVGFDFTQEDDDLPRLVFDIGSSVEGDANELDVDRVLCILGGEAVRGEMQGDSVIGWYRGDVLMQGASARVSSPIAWEGTAVTRAPSDESIAGARYVSSFVGQLGMPVKSAEIDLYPSREAFVVAGFTNNQEYNNLVEMLGGVIVTGRDDKCSLWTGQTVSYKIALPEGSKVRLLVRDDTPETKAMLARMARREIEKGDNA